MESLWVFKLGLIVLMYKISYTRQSHFVPHFMLCFIIFYRRFLLSNNNNNNNRLLCLYNKQNNTWLPVDMEFLFSFSTQHLTLEEKFHIYARPCIILYLTYSMTSRRNPLLRVLQLSFLFLRLRANYLFR